MDKETKKAFEALSTMITNQNYAMMTTILNSLMSGTDKTGTSLSEYSSYLNGGERAYAEYAIQKHGEFIRQLEEL